MPPSPEDVSPTLARAVLPTYLHHVLDASETLADFALERLAGNETARRELETQIETQRETCAAPVSILKDQSVPFARRDEPLSPGARAAKRAADDAKLADLERALRAAVAECGEIEVRLRVAEDAAAALRGAPRELRAVSRLLGDVIADLEAEASDDDDDGDVMNTRAPRSAGSASSGRSGASAGPGSQEAIATAAAILADAERVDPSVPMVTGARVTAVARAAADAADALLSRAQQCLEEEAKLRGLLERAREARRVNANPAAPVRSPSVRGDDVCLVSRSRETSFGASPSASPSERRSGVVPAWSPGGRFLGSAAAARQSDATAKAQARRATQRRSLKDARTQKRVQRNLDYHIARLEGETRRMSTEADALEAHLKRVEANHRRAAGALDTLAWLLEHAEAFRQEAARREAERRRRRERRFAPSGASVKASARARTSVSAFPKDDAVSEASASSRGALGLPMRGGGDADVSRGSRPASRSSAIERWQARAHAEASSAAPAPGPGEEHWREKYARRRDEIVSREAETRRGAPPGAAEAAPAEPTDGTDRRPRRVSPLRRHHDRLMERADSGRRARTPERKSDKKSERGTGAAGAAGATDDEAEQTVPSSLPESLQSAPAPVSSEPTVPVTNAGHELAVRSASETAESERVAAIPMMRLEDLPTATPPVNRVLDLEAPRDALPEGEDEGGDGERLGGDGELPRPETSLEAIEAELAELRRLEFEATGAVPREFETPAAPPSPSPAASLDSARSAATRSTAELREPSRDVSVSGETKKKPKPLPVVDLRPKPRAKPREPWGPPPAPPKTKWKRNSLDRDAVAALKKETIKAREEEEKARAESMNVTRQDAFAPDRDANAPARGGKQLWALDSVKALAPATEKAKKRSSVFKSAYKSLKRAAGIPSKKDKAAAKAKRKERERERERAAAGP